MDEIRLQYSTNGDEPITIRLPANRVVVGSSAQADIRIESRFLSRQHFLIEVQADRIFVTDLGSSNGTMLNGRSLQPHVREEWWPSELLSVADLRFSLLAPAQVPAQTAPIASAVGALSMLAESEVVYPRQPITVTVQYSGSEPQPIYFRVETDTDGLDAHINPPESFIQPGHSINATLEVEKTRALWLGGSFPVTLFAFTNNGLDALAQVTVRVRPRYGALLLLLLLLLIPAGIVGAALLPQITSQQLDTATPLPTSTVTLEPTEATNEAVAVTDEPTEEQPTAPPTETPTEQPTATDEPTDTPTPLPTDTPTSTTTPTPSNTPTSTSTPTTTPFPTSTLIPTRERTPTPIVVVTVIRLPPVFIFPPPPPQPPPQQLSCSGFGATSPVDGLPNGPASFFWTEPAGGGVLNYQLSVTNLETGQSVSTSLPGGSTTAMLDVGLGTLGQGFSFSWTIRARLLNSQSCTDSVALQRAFCDGSQYHPCPGVRLPLDNLAISSLLPDIFTGHDQQQAHTTRTIIDAIGDLLILLALGSGLMYGLRYRHHIRITANGDQQ